MTLETFIKDLKGMSEGYIIGAGFGKSQEYNKGLKDGILFVISELEKQCKQNKEKINN